MAKESVEKEFLRIHLTDDNDLVVGYREYKGKEYGEIRTFFRPEGKQDMYATKKGVTFNEVHIVQQVRDALDELAEYMISLDLAEEEESSDNR